jgi:dTDP-4-dehydrorhamnose 3,5-epimerase
MKFEQTPLAGAFVVIPDRMEDERGFFARTCSRDDFMARGLVGDFVQSSISFNKWKGTLRGLHFQKKPYEETKLVRCTMGAIFDVIVDLRPGSSTLTGWFGIELNPDNRKALYIPQGFAHGFITLTDDSEVLYQISENYRPDSAGGVRWNDAAFSIKWTAEPTVISDRDRNYPDFRT